MKAWLCLVIVLCCAVAVLAGTPSLALRENPEYEPTVVPTDPEHPVDQPERPVEQPVEQPEHPVDSEQPELPVENSDQPERPVENSDQPELPVDNSEQPELPVESSEQPLPNQPTESASSEDKESSESTHMCTMMVITCPDNTTATQNEYCQYICGAAPIGGLTWDQVDEIRNNLESLWTNPKIYSTYITTLYYHANVALTPPESLSDLCIEVNLQSSVVPSGLPEVYNGVRLFFYPEPECSPMLCPDGSYVGCGGVCVEQEDSALFVPIAAIFSVITLASCCCYLRRRRCRARCAASKRCQLQSSSSCEAVPSTQVQVPYEIYYPAEQYELLSQEQEEYVPDPSAIWMAAAPHDPSNPVPVVPPHMMPQMMFPPIPPQMMSNGAFPIMMQAPNGMWYPVPPHPEDA